MKQKTTLILVCLLFGHCSMAQTERIFYSGYERLIKLNDTGVTFAVDANNDYPDCNSSITTQDCHFGRDATHNDDSDGVAGFSFTKLDASGAPLLDQSVDYATDPWTCVRDNVTGLIWEVKIDSGSENPPDWGPHDPRQSWPSPDPLIQHANDNDFCSMNNWREPSYQELLSMVDFSKMFGPFDPAYFPHQPSVLYPNNQFRFRTSTKHTIDVGYPVIWQLLFNYQGTGGIGDDRLSYFAATNENLFLRLVHSPLEQ